MENQKSNLSDSTGKSNTAQPMSSLFDDFI